MFITDFFTTFPVAPTTSYTTVACSQFHSCIVAQSRKYYLHTLCPHVTFYSCHPCIYLCAYVPYGVRNWVGMYYIVLPVHLAFAPLRLTGIHHGCPFTPFRRVGKWVDGGIGMVEGERGRRLTQGSFGSGSRFNISMFTFCQFLLSNLC